MSYQALYRVWRPQTFADVVGQEHVTKTLQNALLQQKISHAYLFTGPRGTGKTSAAKILAKAVNCEHAPTMEPCNQCSACKGITDGSIPDVIEIDAASNTGVDDIRDIRDKVKYAPSAVPFKVYIIDEVHMLSIGAFNALLKTLEEPPKHVIFILATTEPHKIPLTIISRCQRFDFKRITTQAIVERMKLIADESGVSYEENALRIIARAAEGGMRDALSLLDQAISFSNEKLTEEDALVVTGSVGHSTLNHLGRAILEKDIASAMEGLESLFMKGKDPSRFTEDFIHYFRDLLLYKTAPQLEDTLEHPADEEFISLAREFPTDFIYDCIEILNQTQQEMKFTNHARIYLEVAFVKMSQAETKPVASQVQPDLSKLLSRIETLEQELHELRSRGLSPEETSPVKTPPKNPVRSHHDYKVPVKKIEHILKEATKQDLQLLKSRWGEMLEILNQRQMRSQAALLNDAEPVAASPDSFVLKFKYDIHCKMAMENAKFVEAISSVFGELTGIRYVPVGIPEEKWHIIRENFIRQQKENIADDGSRNEEDPLIAEAVKLVGEDLLEIKD